tara:strand:- start:307 stop:594 length:288 start_codon:yes stop_codon:yes gene_type:complete
MENLTKFVNQYKNKSTMEMEDYQIKSAELLNLLTECEMKINLKQEAQIEWIENFANINLAYEHQIMISKRARKRILKSYQIMLNQMVAHTLNMEL